MEAPEHQYMSIGDRPKESLLFHGPPSPFGNQLS